MCFFQHKTEENVQNPPWTREGSDGETQKPWTVKDLGSHTRDLPQQNWKCVKEQQLKVVTETIKWKVVGNKANFFPSNHSDDRFQSPTKILILFLLLGFYFILGVNHHFISKSKIKLFSYIKKALLKCFSLFTLFAPPFLFVDLLTQVLLLKCDNNKYMYFKATLNCCLFLFYDINLQYSKHFTFVLLNNSIYWNITKKTDQFINRQTHIYNQ